MSVSKFLFQGAIQFPDGSTQSTGYNIKQAPTGLTGSIGDKAGDVAYDENGIYYCVQDYAPVLSYTLNFYLHYSQYAFTLTDVEGNDLVGWRISNMINSGTGSITVPENTIVEHWTYDDNGSIIDWTYDIPDFAVNPEGEASFVVTQPSELPIIWKKIEWFGEDTYENWNTKRSAGTLPTGQYVKISDRADSGVLLYCAANDAFAIEGTGCFKNADYQGISDYSSVEGFNSFYGQWATASEETITNGDIVIWNNQHYVVSNYGVFNGTDPSSNTDAYSLTEDIGYIYEWDVIIYDFINDNIKWRIDKRGNKISLYDSNFQWGNDKIRSIGMSTYQSYMTIQNNTGYIHGALTGQDSSIHISNSSGNAFFHVDGTSITMYTTYNSGTIECHMEGFSSGFQGDYNTGEIRVYIYDRSYTNAYYNSGTILASYHGNSQIYHINNTNNIYYCEFKNSYINNLKNVELSNCDISGLGSYGSLIDMENISGTWSGKYYTPHESTFNYVIDETYLHTGVSPSVPNEFDFYSLYIPDSLSFVGEFSLNFDSVYNIDKVSGTREGLAIKLESMNYDFNLYTVPDSVAQPDSFPTLINSSGTDIGISPIYGEDSYNNYMYYPVQYWGNSGISSFVEIQRKNGNLSVNRVINYGGWVERILPLVKTLEVTDITSYSAMSGGIVLIEGDSSVIERGVCINTSGTPTINDGFTVDGSGIGSFTSSITGTAPYTTYYVRAYATNNSGTSYGNQVVYQSDLCLAKGTKIMLSDRSYKLIEDIDYEDTLLVWNFDEGRFDISRPIWIKKPQITNKYNLLTFSDGTELKTISDHRIFNKEKGMFTYPMLETKIGTTTFNAFGEEVRLVSKEVIFEEVEHYNIITNKHINLFANDILTSCRYNNIYPIVDMKFVKDIRQLRNKEEFNVSEEYYNGLRLAEQQFTVGEVEAYLNNLKKNEVIYEIH